MTVQQITRRRMMVRSAAFAAALPVGTILAAKTEKPPIRKPKGFLIGVCDWNLGKQSDPGSFEVARQLGLDGVQVSLGTLADNMHLTQPDVQKQFLKAARDNGVRIASLAIGEMNNIPYKSDSRAEQWVSDSIDTAAALKVKVVLLAFFGNGDLRDDKEGTDVVVERLRKVAPKAEKAGVILGIESWLSAADSMRIVERVGSKAVQVYYDVGNSHLRGYDIYEEIHMLGRNICEFHAKDYDSIFGKGKVDFPRVRSAMDDIGYRGWIQIEGAQPLGLMDSYRQDLEYLRTVFPKKVTTEKV
jgi:sugar phosphate isomerase/epimerase